MIYQSDRVRIDTGAYRVDCAGVPCDLEPKAFDLLVYLVSHAGRVVTKAEILDQVWGGVAVTDNALTRVIAQLRRALGDDAREARFIETVPTRGYRWLPAVSADESPAVVPRVHPAGVAGEAIDLEALNAPAASEHDVASRRARDPRARARTIGYAAAALVLVLLGVAAWARVRTRPAAPPMITFTAGFPVQLTTERGVHVFPSVSPDGRAMIYSSDRSGKFELYLRALERGGVDTPLTHDGMQAVEASWSPDGQRVAFHSMVGGGIWVMPALGGAARQLSAFGSRPSWAPDGRTLAFQSDPLTDLGPAALNARLGSTIWSVPSDGSAPPRALTQPNRPPGGHATPVWSRDGSAAMFLVQGIKLSELWAVRSDGTSLRRLLAIPGPAFDEAIARDGGRLITSNGGTQMYTLPIDPSHGSPAGPPTAITMPSVDGVRFPAAADADRALFAGMTLESQLLALPVDPRTGEPADAPHPITNSSARRTTFPAISPSGEWVAYISGARGAASDVWITRLDGSQTQQVTTSREQEASPAWFDDDALSFVSARGGVPGIWRTSRTSRRESLIVPWPAYGGRAAADDPVRYATGEPRVSPDGSRIVYSALDPASAREVLRLRVVATGEDRVIVNTGDGANYPCWSRDGRTIAFEASHGGYSQIAVISSDGGAVRLLTDRPGQHWVHGFSPDGSRVVSADLESGVWNIVVTSLADRARRVLTSYATPATFVRYPSWSPKGDLIVFEEARLRSNIWSADLAAPESR